MLNSSRFLLSLLATFLIADDTTPNSIRRQDTPPAKNVQDKDPAHWPELTEQQAEVATKLFEEHWKRVDRREQLRRAQPALFQKHRDATSRWVAELETEKLELLLKGRTSGDETKQVRNLSSDFKKTSEELFAHYQLATQLAYKVIQGHWQGMQRNGVVREQVVEYATDFENCVSDWFHQRSIEDLRIFEKPKPNENERQRGEKITAELMQQIKMVQETHGVRDF